MKDNIEENIGLFIGIISFIYSGFLLIMAFIGIDAYTNFFIGLIIFILLFVFRLTFFFPIFSILGLMKSFELEWYSASMFFLLPIILIFIFIIFSNNEFVNLKEWFKKLYSQLILFRK